MDILFVCSEIAPWVHKSALAEVVASLSKTMRQVGHNVTVVVPYSKAYEEGGLLIARRLSPLKIDEADSFTVFDTQLTSGVQLTLFQTDKDPSLPTDLTQIHRFARGVAALVRDRRELGLRTDVLHVLDELGALVGVAAQSLPEPPPVVLTIYDANQAASGSALAAGAKNGNLYQISELIVEGELDATAAALRTASCVITASDAHAKLLKEPSFFGKLATIFNELKSPIVAIPGGIDYARLNPAIDPHTVARYDAEDHLQKSTCKTALQRELGLELDLDSPLCFHPKLTADLGSHAFVESIERLLDLPVSLVIGCHKDDGSTLAAQARGFAEKWPQRIAILPNGSGPSLHRTMSGADFAILTAPQSPMDVMHLFAQRYGTLPIAMATGIFADNLVNCDARLETGHAFLFAQSTPEELLGAAARAVSAYRTADFTRLRRRVMCRDLGWERPARRMVQVYRQVLGIHL